VFDDKIKKKNIDLKKIKRKKTLFDWKEIDGIEPECSRQNLG
jgi:hypothetical protein